MMLKRKRNSDTTDNIVAWHEATVFDSPFAKLITCEGTVYNIFSLRKILIGGPRSEGVMSVNVDGIHPVCAELFYSYEFMCFRIKVVKYGATVDGKRVYKNQTVSLANNSTFKIRSYKESLTLFLPILVNDLAWKSLVSKPLSCARVKQEETTDGRLMALRTGRASDNQYFSQQELEQMENMDLYELIGCYRYKEEPHPFPFFLLCVYILKNYEALTVQEVTAHISNQFLYYGSEEQLPMLRNEVEIAFHRSIFKQDSNNWTYTCRLELEHEQQFKRNVKRDIILATMKCWGEIFPAYAMTPRPIDQNLTLPLHAAIDMDVVKQKLEIIIDTSVNPWFYSAVLCFYLPGVASKSIIISHVINIYDIGSLSAALEKLKL